MRTSFATGLITAILIISNASFSASANTLEKIKETGSITLGYRETSIPFSYLNGTTPVGFSWDICEKVVEQVRRVTGRKDLTVRTQNVNSTNRIPLVKNGTVDLECGNTTNNIERNKEVAFSINIFYTGTNFLVKAGSPTKSINDLKGKLLAVQVGTTNLIVVRKLDRELGLNINMTSTRDHSEGLLLLLAGRVDAYAADDVVLYGLRSKATNPGELSIVGDPIQVEPYALMMRKDDPEFKRLVDKVIGVMIQNGEFQTLYKKWFQSPIPPTSGNLEVPMNPALDASLKKMSDKPIY